MPLSGDTLYASRIFLNAVLPNLKTIAQDLPEFKKSWKGKNAVCQVSALCDEGKIGTHFIIEDGEWTVKLGIYEKKPTVELIFSSADHLNGFFQNKTKKMPKFKGLSHPGIFIAFMKTLLKMAALLGMTKPPADEKTQVLLVKMYFYLLPVGISQLNKTGHEKIANWANMQPNRIFSFEVQGCPEVSTYLNVKAGKSRVGRGVYSYSMPFFTMYFTSCEAALKILMGIDDMVDAQVSGRMVLDGAPEVGMMVGDFLLTVAAYAKGTN
jgi:hypothetical protein